MKEKDEKVEGKDDPDDDDEEDGEKVSRSLWVTHFLGSTRFW